MASVTDDIAAIAPGTVLGETFTVLSLIGSGAFGTVYRVRHRFLGVQALKLLRVQDAGVAFEILQEGRILAGLSHSHVVRIFDANLLDLPCGRVPYLSMEHVAHGTLASLLQLRTRLDVIEALTVAIQILDGLNAIHALSPPILHRDLTPANILVASKDHLQIKIGDFGLATYANPNTGLAHAVGVIRYLPPESTWGHATIAGDLYATALILYEMLTGAAAYQLPRSAEEISIQRLQRAVLAPRRQPPLPPSRFRQELDPAVDGLIVRALSPEQRNRFPDAKSFSSAIRTVMGIVRTSSWFS